MIFLWIIVGVLVLHTIKLRKDINSNRAYIEMLEHVSDNGDILLAKEIDKSNRVIVNNTEQSVDNLKICMNLVNEMQSLLDSHRDETLLISAELRKDLLNTKHQLQIQINDINDNPQLR